MKKLRIDVEFDIKNEEQVQGWLDEFGLTWKDLLLSMNSMIVVGDVGTPLYLYKTLGTEVKDGSLVYDYWWGEYGMGSTWEQKAGPVRWDVHDSYAEVAQ